jgi:hypothetical protein
MRSFVICKQKGEMGAERGIVREDRNGHIFWWGNLKESNHLEDLGVDGSIILQVMKHKQGLARLCHFGVVTVRCTKHFVQGNLGIYSLWVLSSGFASCHPYGAWNFEAAPRFLENLCTAALQSEKHSINA